MLCVTLDAEDCLWDMSAYVNNQEEMIEWLCQEVDNRREQLGMTRCRYDFRLASIREVVYSDHSLPELTFALYLESD